MRVVQYKILKNILEKIEVPEYICAFEKNRSIPEMAQVHVGKYVVVSLDLKDYFPSIKQYHLQQLFEHLGFSASPARTLSELCTYESFVPQGALTSPKVSNIMTALTFGPIIKNYCDSKNYSLTIYADDITISSDRKIDGQNGTDTLNELITFITNTVRRFGFRVNTDKTKVMARYRRQYVCGVVVNEKTNLQKKERDRLKAIVHNCDKNGLDTEATKNGLTASEFSSRIMGKLNWFEQLNAPAGNLMKEKFKVICKRNNIEEETKAEIISTPVVESIPASAPW